jgi:hypothetical protein
VLAPGTNGKFQAWRFKRGKRSAIIAVTLYPFTIGFIRDELHGLIGRGARDARKQLRTCDLTKKRTDFHFFENPPNSVGFGFIGMMALRRVPQRSIPDCGYHVVGQGFHRFRRYGKVHSPCNVLSLVVQDIFKHGKAVDGYLGYPFVTGVCQSNGTLVGHTKRGVVL